MNNINISDSTLKKIELCAGTYGLSAAETVDKALDLLVVQAEKERKEKERERIKAAFAFIDTIPAADGRPVPDDERGSL